MMLLSVYPSQTSSRDKQLSHLASLFLAVCAAVSFKLVIEFGLCQVMKLAQSGVSTDHLWLSQFVDAFHSYRGGRRFSTLRSRRSERHTLPLWYRPNPSRHRIRPLPDLETCPTSDALHCSDPRLRSTESHHHRHISQFPCHGYPHKRADKSRSSCSTIQSTSQQLSASCYRSTRRAVTSERNLGKLPKPLSVRK